MQKNFTLLLILLSGLVASAQTTKVQTVTIGTPLYNMNGKLLFAGMDSHNLFQLWSSDGTPGGTTMLHDFYNTTYHSGSMERADNASTGRYQPIVYNNELYFFAYNPASGHGIDLYKTDGTAAGTVYLRTFTNEFYGATWQPGGISMCIYENALYFSLPYNFNGAKLWKTTGGAPTQVFNYLGAWDSPEHLTVYNGLLYFMMDDGVHGSEVWKSDGTAAGTSMLKDYFSGNLGVGNVQDMTPNYANPNFIVSGNYLYFTGYRNADGGWYSLYRTDGTTAGTIRLPDTTVFVDDTYSFPEAVQADLNGKLIFTAYPDGLSDKSSNIFTSDGVTTENLVTNNNIVTHGDFKMYKGKLFFDGVEGAIGHEQYGLFVSDGTTAGTSAVKLFAGGASQPKVADFDTAFGSLFFRQLFLTSPSLESWRMVQSYGTPESTTIHYGAEAIGGGTTFNGAYYFYGNDSGANYSTTSGLFKIIPAPDNTGALPVKWLSFDATVAGSDVDLRWTTASEVNNAYYVVERSRDAAVHFDSIGRVEAVGSGSDPYGWVDHGLSPGAYSYRLRQVDLDGKFSYSVVRKVDVVAGGGVSAEDRLQISPNPVVNDRLRLRYPAFAGRGIAQITDLSGRVLATYVCDGSVRVLEINADRLSAGIYHLTVRNGAGVVGVARFLKK